MAEDTFAPKRLLVTGGAGFIGSNLVHWLWREHAASLQRVVVLDALTYAGNLMNLERLPLPSGRERDYFFVKGDVCDGELVSRLFEEHDFDAVLHLAAESHVDRSIEDPGAFVRTNVIGTHVLLDVARRRWRDEVPRRFVLVSTDEVYGALGAEGEFSEETPYAPNSPYAASKAGADLLARACFKTYGLPVIITNCSNNYGPRQLPEKLIPLMIRNAKAEQRLPVYGAGKQVRDWLHVDDHCEGLWLALTRGVPGEKYNFGGGYEAPNLEIVETIADAVDAILERPAGTSRGLIAFVPDRPGHDFRYAIDASKAKGHLGWKGGREFSAGLTETVRWYLENEAWLAAAISGEYLRFYESNYDRRPVTA